MIGFDELMLVASEVIIIFLGGLIIYVGVRAYRRTKSRSVLAVSLGFAVMVTGSLAEEIVLQLLPYPMTEAHIIRNSIEAVGLLILVYSLYGVRD